MCQTYNRHGQPKNLTPLTFPSIHTPVKPFFLLYFLVIYSLFHIIFFFAFLCIDQNWSPSQKYFGKMSIVILIFYQLVVYPSKWFIKVDTSGSLGLHIFLFPLTGFFLFLISIFIHETIFRRSALSFGHLGDIDLYMRV